MTICTTCARANVDCPVYPKQADECVEYRSEAKNESSDEGASIELLVSCLRDKQTRMTDEQRVELWASLRDGYCYHCGISYLPCYSCNDE